MATLLVMKNRIADELRRADLTNQIANAISDAIAFHERERFWFNESRDKTLTTVAAQRIYTSSDATWIPNVIEVDAMFVTVSGQNRCVSKADPAELELLSDSSGSSGPPYHWAYLNSNIQLYPIPDDAYTVRVLAHVRLDALAGDSSTNAWTTEAEMLIRRTAKIFLTAEVKDGADKESLVLLDPLVRQSLDALRAETSRRKTIGRIVPTQF